MRMREKELIGRKKKFINLRSNRQTVSTVHTTYSIAATAAATTLLHNTHAIYINKTLSMLRITNLMYEDEWADDKYIVSHRLAAGA